MALEILLVLLLTGGTVYLFVTEKFRADLVAMMVLGTLLLIGLLARLLPWMHLERWVTPEEGVSGFSNPATITVAAMFVLSAGLQKTGAVATVGRWLSQLSQWPSVLLIVMMLSVGLVSAFINNTAAVAVFLPLVLAACDRGRISPSKLLIPLSFASQFGGVCTLIGTSTNLLVSSISARAGSGEFSMFEFTRLGLVLLAAGTAYLLLVGRWFLPSRRGEQLTENYQLGEYITELRVQSESPLIGLTVQQTKLGQAKDVTVLEMLRRGQTLFAPLAEPVQAGDVLLVRGGVRELMELKSTWKLEIEPEFKLKDEALEAKNLQLAEVLVAPQSSLLDRTLAEVQFRRRYDAIVLAIQARQQTVREKLNQVRLGFGDALLLLAPKEAFSRLRGDPDFLVLETVDEPALRRRKIPLAVAIIAAVVGLAATNVMPILVSSIIGCVALVATRCITLEEAYASIDWKVIFLLAGVLPLGLAIEKSGAAQLLANSTLALVGPFGPITVLAVLYLLTAVLTEFMSNSATAVLLAPIALSTATALGVDPRPFLLAVCFAASTSFATPVGYQTNAMVYHAGGYQFTDFARVGIPLNIIFWGLSVYFIPKWWPL
ncbi:MAG: SLC13 family permease [Verrucomicrobia bacterium]|nr:SLC13 family permease [Verrucomicrobiota bacterium]